MHYIKIYGMGCRRCDQLHQNVMEALELVDIQAAVIKVEDLIEIADAGVGVTPCLEIDGKIVSQGRLPTVAKVTDMLRQAAERDDV